MQISEVHDYASRLLREHGDKAQLIASQRVLECEKRGDRSEADDWRRIRDTLKEMKGPLAS
jgi:hypothetical protein